MDSQLTQPSVWRSAATPAGQPADSHLLTTDRPLTINCLPTCCLSLSNALVRQAHKPQGEFCSPAPYARKLGHSMHLLAPRYHACRKHSGTQKRTCYRRLIPSIKLDVWEQSWNAKEEEEASSGAVVLSSRLICCLRGQGHSEGSHKKAHVCFWCIFWTADLFQSKPSLVAHHKPKCPVIILDNYV